MEDVLYQLLPAQCSVSFTFTDPHLIYVKTHIIINHPIHQPFFSDLWYLFMAFYGNLTSSIKWNFRWKLGFWCWVCPCLPLGSTLACAAAAPSFAAPPAHQVRQPIETVAAGAQHLPSSSGSAWICSFHAKHARKMIHGLMETPEKLWKIMENQ